MSWEDVRRHEEEDFPSRQAAKVPRYIAVKILYGLSTCQNYLYYSQIKLLAVNDKVLTFENWLDISPSLEECATSFTRYRISLKNVLGH